MQLQEQPCGVGEAVDHQQVGEFPRCPAFDSGIGDGPQGGLQLCIQSFISVMTQLGRLETTALLPVASGKCRVAFSEAAIRQGCSISSRQESAMWDEADVRG